VSDLGPTADGDARSFLSDHVPFAGFELSVIVDASVYAPGQVVRMTVTAVNSDERFAEHHYPGWQRFTLRILDEFHRAVADAEVSRAAERTAVDRWLPGQMVIFPVYWAQHEGPIVPAWSSRSVGPRVDPGRYRARVSWLGREPDSSAEPPDAFSPYFELT
jgi:hypothetical protein